jgi:hypothetical protein
LKDLLIDNPSLLKYQEKTAFSGGAEDEGITTLNIKRHRFGIMPVGCVFLFYVIGHL